MRRYVLPLLIAAALHGLFVWILQRSRPLPPTPEEETVVETELLTPQRVAQATPAAPRSSPPTAAPAKPSLLRGTPPAGATPPAPPMPTSEPAPAASLSPESMSDASATPSPGSPTASAASAPAGKDAPTSAAGASGAAHGAPAGEAFSMPPSAELRYASYVNGVQNQTGEIHWESGPERYRLAVEVPIVFLGSFVYRSTGGVDAFGLAPTRYEETRGKRAPVATNFNRDARQSVTFSRVDTTYPLPDGVQDRFSMVMQLAALVRADPQRYGRGVTREFPVADTDSLETWRIQSRGEVPLDTAQGTLPSLHLVRLPRYADDRRQLEIWLARELGWLPAKIRQTEPNGTVFELVFEALDGHGLEALRSAPRSELIPRAP